MMRFARVFAVFALAACSAAGVAGTGVPRVPGPGSNHLRGQSSPYLLQHVDNPVDWYP